jgi:glycosyltransferase involved in cell wall biosynthesis
MAVSPALEGRGRTVLVLTYRWPPQGGGGVQRTLKLVKYLSELGWRCVVHTVANPYSRLWDPTLSEEVPEGLKVYRTPTVEYESLRAGVAGIGSNARNLLRRDARAANAVAGDGTRKSSGANDEVGTRAALRRRGWAGRAEDWLWSRVLVPDPQIVWAKLALPSALRIVREEKPSVLYSTSPPNSINVLALALAEKANLPWIADFRDPWTDGIRRQQWYPDNPARERKESAWERSIFEHANFVLATTVPTRDRFVEKYPWCPKDRVQVMTNGFDPADFSHVDSQDPILEPEMLHLSLSGNVETLFDLLPFLKAVREVLDADPDARNLLRINFLGTKRQAHYDGAIEKFGIGDVIRFHAYMPHERVVQMVAESDALMLCQIPAKESGGMKLPGKMFEYLYTRKPVLALTIPGETTAVLDAAGVGRVVNPNDSAGIRAELEQFLYEYRNGGLQSMANEKVISSFDRKRQALRVAELLDRAAFEGRR